MKYFKTVPLDKVMTERLNASKKVYKTSLQDTKLQKEILQKMTRDHYDLWANVDIEEAVFYYQSATLHFRMSFLIMWWFANKDANQRSGCVCPSVGKDKNPICMFRE